MVHESIWITREKEQSLTIKVPLGPNALIPHPCSEFTQKKKTLRDAEKQAPGVPSPCVIMQLGYIFCLTQNSVWVSVFVFWKIHKRQNSRFPFILQHPPFPTHRRNPINPEPSLKQYNENKSQKEQQPPYY